MKCNSIFAMTLVGTVILGSAALAKTCGDGSHGGINQCANPQPPPACNAPGLPTKPPACPPKPPACPPKPPVDPPCQGDTTADSSTLFGSKPPLAGPPPCCNPVRSFTGASTPSSSTCHPLFGNFSFFANVQSDDD